MNQQQLQTFLYSCQKEALKLHFNNQDGIVKFMFANGRLEDKTFIDALKDQRDLLNSLHTGICFSMASWVFELLFSIGADDYYFMESENSYWSNFVILYRIDDEYRICDLAAEVRKNESLINGLIDVSPEELPNIQESLKNSKYLSRTPDEYTKSYPIQSCKVLLHEGNENSLYYEVPRIGLNEFLQRKNEVDAISNNIKH